jgi:hypothetical protein
MLQWFEILVEVTEQIIWPDRTTKTCDMRISD